MSDETSVPAPRPKHSARAYPPRQVVEARRLDGWDDEIHLADYWRLLVARRWTVLAILFTVVTATIIWTFSLDPVYSATSRIQIDREDPNILSFQDVYTAELSTDDGLRTQFEILESRTLARRVVDELRLAETPEFLPVEPGVLGSVIEAARDLVASDDSAASGTDPFNRVVDQYLEQLTVTPVRQARLVDINFESKDPVFAAQVINAHGRLFIDQNLRFRFEATELASDFLSDNLTRLKINLEKAEDQLQAYGRENQIIFSEDGESTAAEKLQQLESEYTSAQAARFAQEAYVQLIREGDSGAIAQVAENELITSLNTQLTELKSEESDIAVTFGPEFPARQRLRSRIEETERLLNQEVGKVLRTVEAEYQAALGRERLLAEAVRLQEDLVNNVNQEIIQYDILQREADAARRLYEGLLNRLGEANISSTLQASNIRIIDRATVPDRPIKPRKALNLLLGVLIGLGLGVGAAFAQEHFDDSINSTEQIGHVLGVPTLGVIPKAGRNVFGGIYAYRGTYGKIAEGEEELPAVREENRLEFVSHDEPTSVVSEAYRSVRTSLLLSFPDNPPRSILFTSPAPGEGKTVTALNVAISLTQTGARTVLVSTDMRKPRLDSLFTVSNGTGLSGILTGTHSLEESICPHAIPNLYLLPCGAIPPNPAELLASNRFRDILSELGDQFDYVVLDSPPVGNVSDARILAHYVDCTIVVVRAASTSKHLAKHVLEQLSNSGSRTAGVILNDVDARYGHTYYAYHSSYQTPYSRA